MSDVTLKLTSGKKLMNNRAYKSVPDYLPPSQFMVGQSQTTQLTVSSSSLDIPVPISGAETVDDCSVTTGWTASGTNSLTVNSTTYKYDDGSNAALNIVKSDASSATVSVSKTTTSVDGTSKDFFLWVYVKDATALAKLKSSGTAFEVRFGSDSSNYYYYTAAASTLIVGWNLIKLAIPSGWTGTTSSPSISALDYTYIAFVTNNVTDTFVAGDIIFDAIRVVSADDYLKDFDSISIDESTNEVTVEMRLESTEATGFLLDSLLTKNKDASPLCDVASKFPNSSKSDTDIIIFTVVDRLL